MIMAPKEINDQKRKSSDETDGPPAKKSLIDFSVDVFHKRLRKEERFEALEEFVQLCRKCRGSYDPAEVFLKGGGQLSDIVKCLQHGRDKNTQEVCSVFSVFHILLLRVLTKVPEEKENAEEVCHYFLDNHLNAIHRCLESKNFRSKKAVLQLLTAIVTLSPTLAKDVLSYVNFNIRDVDDIVEAKKSDDPQNVRVCFIHFLMAFLVESNLSVVRMLLEKRLLLTSIIPHLQYDPFNLVIFVLTTLRTKLVEEMNIPKTQKLRTFNTRVMESLLYLYHWKGPAGYNKKTKVDEDESVRELIVNPEQQQAVAEAVHSLLLILCTSHRRGVLFHDSSFGSSEYKPNTLVGSVFRELTHPWEHKLKADLCVQVIKAAPEFAQRAYAKVIHFLHPRASPAWLRVINFITKVVASIKLSGLTLLPPKTALSVAKDLVVPQSVLSCVARPGLLHGNAIVRQKTTVLLQTDLHLIEECLSFLPEQQALEFKNYAMKVIPNGAVLVEAWKLSLNQKPEEKTPSIFEPIPSAKEQLLVLLDVMFLYQCLFPQLLVSDSVLDELTTTLAETLDLEIIDDDDNILSLQIKVMQFLTCLDTSVILPGKPGFIGALKMLLVASCKNNALSSEAQSALGALLLKCQVLESSETDVTGELGIWLQSFLAIKPSQRAAIVSFLEEVLVNVATNPGPYIERILKAQEQVIITSDLEEKRKKNRKVHVDQAGQIFEELLGMVEREKSTQKMQGSGKLIAKDYKILPCSEYASSVGLSVLLMGALDYVESKEDVDASVTTYLSHVLVHLLHLQADPLPYIFIMRHWVGIPSAVLEYIEGWAAEQPIALSKPFGSSSPESSISQFLLEQDRKIPELEDCSDPVCVLLWERLVLFHVSQLAEKQLLTKVIATACVDMLTALFNALQETLSHCNSLLVEKYSAKFFNLILRHPILLSYFSPLEDPENIQSPNRKKKLSKNLITHFFLSFLKKSVDCKPSLILTSSCVFLKEKLIRSISRYLAKSSLIPPRTKSLIAVVEMLSFTGSETSDLLWKLKDKMMEYPWRELVCFLLHKVDFLPSEQVTVLGNNLAEYLQNEEDPSSAVWNVADAFHNYLKRYPRSIPDVSSNLFQACVCERGLNLASILLQHQKSFVPIFTRSLEEKSPILHSPKVLFPLLSTATHHGCFPSSILKIVYDQYRPDIIKALEPPFAPNEVLENHPDIIRQLIVEHEKIKTCQQICLSLRKNWKSLELCTPFYMSVIEGLQKVGGWRKEGPSLIQLLTNQVKQMLLNKAPSALIIQTCSCLTQHLVDYRINWMGLEVKPNEDWKALPVLILQTGLNGSDVSLTSSLFSTFGALLWRTKATQMAGQVFEMTLSHSLFLDIVLAVEHDGKKLAVLKLLLTCGQLAPHVMKSAQIPIWLGAYGASLSHSDQTILKILHFLSCQKDINLSAYRPFLWGEAAISHYSVRSRAGMSLWRVPQASVTLELLQADMVQKTIASFPLNRKLLFGEPDVSLSSNKFITGYVEHLEFNQPDVYDPAFLIPLLNHIMAPESVIKFYQFSRAGGLAITLASLGSNCVYLRGAALSVLSRYYNHLVSNRYDTQIEEHLVLCILGGLRNLKRHTMDDTVSPHKQKKKKLEVDAPENSDETPPNEFTSFNKVDELPKVPNVASTFLARASLVLSNSLEEMYKPLAWFILAKPAMNLRTVPEYLQLIRPDNINYRKHQVWLLETIQQGIRTLEDVKIVRSYHIYKLLFSFYSSSVSDTHLKVLIFGILEATLAVQSGAKHLWKCGVVPWLYSVFNNLMQDRDEKAENSGLRLAFIRVTVSLQEYMPLGAGMVVPFLLKLPPIVETSDIHSILHVASAATKHLSQDHLIVLLRLCCGILDQKVIEECSSLLGLLEKIHKQSELAMDNKEKLVSDDNNRHTKHTAINDLLKSVVHNWLMCTRLG